MADTGITNTGHTLTTNESRFIDKYIETGNATQAYIYAYAKDPENPPKGARQGGARVMSKAYIVEEIKYRLQQIQNDTIASAEEIMQYFTDVMRGVVKDQFGLDASLSERTKAAQELAKRQIDMAQRNAQMDTPPEIKIVLDWTPATQGENKE